MSKLPKRPNPTKVIERARFRGDVDLFCSVFDYEETNLVVLDDDDGWVVWVVEERMTSLDRGFRKVRWMDPNSFVDDDDVVGTIEYCCCRRRRRMAVVESRLLGCRLVPIQERPVVHDDWMHDELVNTLSTRSLFPWCWYW